jgi:hypothetical protein
MLRRLVNTTAVPFICKKCGEHYGEGGIVFNGDITGVELGQGHLNANARCRCGTWNKPALPDGKYNIRNGRWEFIRQVTQDILSAQPTAEDVQRLAQVLQNAKENSSGAEQAASAIEKDGQFAKAAETILKWSHDHPPSWGAWILAIIISAVIPYIISTISSHVSEPDKTSPPAVVQLSPQQIDQIAQRVAHDLESQYSRPAHKVGRNEPCHCGSDLKYKKCCGDPAKRTASQDKNHSVEDAA